MTTSVQLVRNVPQQRRVTRKPSHNWLLKFRPYQIQPCAIAPVLPGESLTSALFQARAKTDALAGTPVDLLGWWLEHYWVYVPLTVLDGADDFRSMLLSFGVDISAHDAAADVQTYHAGPGVDWTAKCLDAIVTQFFRDEEDGTVTFDGLPMAGIPSDYSWLDSAKLGSDTSDTDHELPGENPLVPDELQAAFSAHYTQWEYMRSQNLTSASYEDWLRAYGVTPPVEERNPEEHKVPELLRYSREFQYPSVVVDGASGSSTSAVVWSVAERIDKRRFFAEPGFIVGCTVARPKVYFSGQRGAAVSMLNDAFAWLPAVLREHPYTSLKSFSTTAGTGADGPLADVPSGDYWVDLRDLFLYGDQFVNFDVSSTPAGFVALPTSAMQKRFPAEAAIDALFDDAAGGSKYVHQEGRIAFDILGTQRETT